MAKNLKLKGLKTYTNGVTGTTIIKKDDVVRFDDDIAAKVEKGFRLNAEQEEIPYWEVVGDDVKVTHDFSTKKSEDAPVASVATVVAGSQRGTAAAKRVAR
jgi:hypothetical protein